MAGQLVSARQSDSSEDIGIRRVDGLFIGREEWTALKDRNSRQLPVTRQHPGRAALGQPALAGAEGQIVEIRRQKALPSIVDHVAVVEAGIESVGEKTAAGHGKRGGRHAACIGKVACEHVTQVEAQRLLAVPR